MPELDQLLIFVAAGIALNLTPGPDMLYTIARSVGQGRTAGVVSSLGIASGAVVHILAATFGLSALFAYSATAYLVLKYIGAGYLIYLGIRAILAGRRPELNREARPISLGKIYWQAVLTNLLNPKVALFFLSFLPQFVDPAAGSVAMQTLLLGILFDFNSTIVLIAIALAAGTAGQWLAKRTSFWKWQQRVTGSILVALGARLAWPDHR